MPARKKPARIETVKAWAEPDDLRQADQDRYNGDVPVVILRAADWRRAMAERRLLDVHREFYNGTGGGFIVNKLEAAYEKKWGGKK